MRSAEDDGEKERREDKAGAILGIAMTLGLLGACAVSVYFDISGWVTVPLVGLIWFAACPAVLAWDERVSYWTIVRRLWSRGR